MPSRTRTVRHTLADGTVKTYSYKRKKPAAPSARHPADSIGATIIAYKRAPEWADLADTTRRNYTLYLEPLERLAHLPLSSIRRAHLFELRDAVAKVRGHGAGTGFVRAAQALFSWARNRGLIEASPADRMPALRGGHLPAWTQAQAEAALKGLPDHLARVVLLALHTGQRRTDLCRLPWNAFDGKAIRLVQGKTGRALMIPASPELRTALATWRTGATATTILTDAAGHPWDPTYLSHALPTALERLGLPRLGVHGLRKLAAARLADAGCTPHQVAAITGHTTLSMVQFYTRSADQERLATAAIHRLGLSQGVKRGKPKLKA